jgi:hypothetical protein
MAFDKTALFTTELTTEISIELSFEDSARTQAEECIRNEQKHNGIIH